MYGQSRKKKLRLFKIKLRGKKDILAKPALRKTIDKFQ